MSQLLELHPCPECNHMNRVAWGPSNTTTAVRCTACARDVTDWEVLLAGEDSRDDAAWEKFPGPESELLTEPKDERYAKSKNGGLHVIRGVPRPVGGRFTVTRGAGRGWVEEGVFGEIQVGRSRAHGQVVRDADGKPAGKVLAGSEVLDAVLDAEKGD